MKEESHNIKISFEALKDMTIQQIIDMEKSLGATQED